MKGPTIRIGVIAAALNVIAFGAIIASKPPAYAQMQRLEEQRKAGGPFSFTSADPYFVAGRAFYPHAMPPWPEFLYFLINFPAESTSSSLWFDVLRPLNRARAPNVPISEARDSWGMAIAFIVCATLQGFVMGAVIAEWRRRRESS